MKGLQKKVVAIATLVAIVSFGVISAIGCSGGEEKNEEGEDEVSHYLIPAPNSFEKSQGEFILKDSTKIVLKGNDTKELRAVGEYFNNAISKATGYSLSIEEGELGGNGIFLYVNENKEELGKEGYNLVVNKDSVEISAYTEEGIFRGISSLRQLFPAEINGDKIVTNIPWIAKGCIIEDKPEYEYRSFMLDVSRHFFTVDQVKRQIDNIAQYKINKLHLHLSDDQGWRLEIKKYPDLVNIGSKTSVGGGVGGYYTQEDFKEIVRYAKERYIEVIPEFDMPGHTNAALASYGFLNPDGEKKEGYTGIGVGFSTLMCRDEKTYEFVEDIIKEVSQISPSKYIHIGGDEAHKTSKEDYNYFVGRVTNLVTKYDKIPIGWDPADGAPETPDSFVLQNWKGVNEKAVARNQKIIISKASKAYLDMKYYDDVKLGLKWAGTINIADAYNWEPEDFAPKENILGVESPLWTETLTTTEDVEFMMFPRIMGYSEIGWTSKENRNLDNYLLRVKERAKALDFQGINYYKDPYLWKE